METMNLDKLMEQAGQKPNMSDAEHVERIKAIHKMERMFATHGPALVAVLKMVPVIIGHDPNAPLCHANQLRQECINLLTLLDQEATCQK